MMLIFKQLCKSLLAVALTTALVLTSFSTIAPTAFAGPDTGIVLAQASKYTEGLQPLRSRMSELEGYVNKGDWNNVRAFIRGPLGELGPLSRRLKDSLPSTAQGSARRTIRGLTDHLNKLDVAAAKGNAVTAAKEYAGTISAFDAVLGLS
ncbi:MAG: photosystem II protein PsbQ [Acaryochloris sp. RU_4_1]|nr:photosystem II protein PsbQ [Acaryochloris sp. SU_5_25]NJM66205.1 photosystem II protein PsbQ [Acaryochloris sp. RU_4_1]NJN37906.1 photosystem II protein PsbQ [Acaryochloridaceae cyanobacterium CSU_3_4]NJR55294.1 photosystem II protein PsbQ [Acaryochloris sp. CRU_2_0]